MKITFQQQTINKIIHFQAKNKNSKKIEKFLFVKKFTDRTEKQESKIPLTSNTNQLVK